MKLYSRLALFGAATAAVVKADEDQDLSMWLRVLGDVPAQEPVLTVAFRELQANSSNGTNTTTTVAPTTVAVTTVVVTTTVAPTTVAVTTVAPTTVAVEVADTTAAQNATAAPTTEAATSAATDAPATDAPATDAPATDAPEEQEKEEQDTTALFSDIKLTDGKMSAKDEEALLKELMKAAEADAKAAVANAKAAITEITKLNPKLITKEAAKAIEIMASLPQNVDMPISSITAMPTMKALISVAASAELTKIAAVTSNLSVPVRTAAADQTAALAKVDKNAVVSLTAAIVIVVAELPFDQAVIGAAMQGVIACKKGSDVHAAAIMCNAMATMLSAKVGSGSSAVLVNNINGVPCALMSAACKTVTRQRALAAAPSVRRLQSGSGLNIDYAVIGSKEDILKAQSSADKLTKTADSIKDLKAQFTAAIEAEAKAQGTNMTVTPTALVAFAGDIVKVEGNVTIADLASIRSDIPESGDADAASGMAVATGIFTALAAGFMLF